MDKRDYIEVDGGYKLTRTQTFNSGIKEYEGNINYAAIYRSGDVVARPGWFWDGASGISIDSKGNIRASFQHDLLYGLIRRGILPNSARKQADRLFWQTCREDGMNFIRAGYHYLGVRLFGWLYV